MSAATIASTLASISDCKKLRVCTSSSRVLRSSVDVAKRQQHGAVAAGERRERTVDHDLCFVLVTCLVARRRCRRRAGIRRRRAAAAVWSPRGARTRDHRPTAFRASPRAQSRESCARSGWRTAGGRRCRTPPGRRPPRTASRRSVEHAQALFCLDARLRVALRFRRAASCRMRALRRAIAVAFASTSQKLELLVAECAAQRARAHEEHAQRRALRTRLGSTSALSGLRRIPSCALRRAADDGRRRGSSVVRATSAHVGSPDTWRGRVAGWSVAGHRWRRPRSRRRLRLVRARSRRDRPRRSPRCG